MKRYGDYLIPVTVKGRGYLEGSANPTPKYEPGPKPKQERKERERQHLDAEANRHRTPPLVTVSQVFPSAPTWNPIQSTQLAQFTSLMAHLPQDVVVKTEEDTDMMGSLDPHYFEQYGGKHLPSLTATHSAMWEHLQLLRLRSLICFGAGAANFPPAMNCSNINNASFYNMVGHTSQLPPLARTMYLPWNTGFAGFNDVELGVPMALPNPTVSSYT